MLHRYGRRVSWTNHLVRTLQTWCNSCVKVDLPFLRILINCMILNYFNYCVRAMVTFYMQQMQRLAHEVRSNRKDKLLVQIERCQNTMHCSLLCTRPFSNRPVSVPMLIQVHDHLLLKTCTPKTKPLSNEEKWARRPTFSCTTCACLEG